MSLKAVLITREAVAVCVAHSTTTEREEVMGLLLGDWYPSTTHSCVFVYDACPQTRSDRRPDRVEASPTDIAAASEDAERVTKRVRRRTRVVGWYHSHPHITDLPSHVDVGTQGQYQALDAGFVGIIVSCFSGSRRASHRSTAAATPAPATTAQAAGGRSGPPAGTLAGTSAAGTPPGPGTGSGSSSTSSPGSGAVADIAGASQQLRLYAFQSINKGSESSPVWVRRTVPLYVTTVTQFNRWPAFRVKASAGASAIASTSSTSTRDAQGTSDPKSRPPECRPTERLTTAAAGSGIPAPVKASASPADSAHVVTYSKEGVPLPVTPLSFGGAGGPPGSRDLLHTNAPGGLIRPLCLDSAGAAALSRLLLLQQVLYGEERAAFRQHYLEANGHPLQQMHHCGVYTKALCRMIELSTVPLLQTAKARLRAARMQLQRLRCDNKSLRGELGSDGVDRARRRLTRHLPNEALICTSEAIAACPFAARAVQDAEKSQSRDASRGAGVSPAKQPASSKASAPADAGHSAPPNGGGEPGSGRTPLSPRSSEGPMASSAARKQVSTHPAKDLGTAAQLRSKAGASAGAAAGAGIGTGAGAVLGGSGRFPALPLRSSAMPASETASLSTGGVSNSEPAQRVTGGEAGAREGADPTASGTDGGVEESKLGRIGGVEESKLGHGTVLSSTATATGSTGRAVTSADVGDPAGGSRIAASSDASALGADSTGAGRAASGRPPSTSGDEALALQLANQLAAADRGTGTLAATASDPLGNWEDVSKFLLEGGLLLMKKRGGWTFGLGSSSKECHFAIRQNTSGAGYVVMWNDGRDTLQAPCIGIEPLGQPTGAHQERPGTAATKPTKMKRGKDKKKSKKEKKWRFSFVTPPAYGADIEVRAKSRDDYQRWMQWVRPTLFSKVM